MIYEDFYVHLGFACYTLIFIIIVLIHKIVIEPSRGQGQQGARVARRLQFENISV
jgi:hypothetical protein